MKKSSKPTVTNPDAASLYQQRLDATTTAVMVIADSKGRITNLVQIGEPISLLQMAALLRAGGDQAMAAHIRQSSETAPGSPAAEPARQE